MQSSLTDLASAKVAIVLCASHAGRLVADANRCGCIVYDAVGVGQNLCGPVVQHLRHEYKIVLQNGGGKNLG
jgi:hypothetical protein